MKANELMIGDWVKFPNSDLPHQVYAVQGKSLKIDKQYWHKADKLQPIPLTAEILEKNGFEHHRIFDGGSMEENWKFYDDYYDIKVYEWSDSIWVYRYEGTEMDIPHEQIVISYVNELQHALKKCGIKKEIEL